MGLFDYFKSTSISEIENVDKKQPETKRAKNRILQTQLSRTPAQIDLWRKALSTAESTLNPNRTELIRLYNEVKLDNHLSALMLTRILKVQGHEFNIVDSEGEVDEVSTDYFKSEWFSKFIQYSMESKFEGTSVIQFGGVKNDRFESIELIPRQYVIPNKNVIKLGVGQIHNTINYNSKPFSDWLLAVGDPLDLGLLSKASPMVIWKKNALGSWAEFQEKFGQPARIVKTDTDDEENVAKADEMLAQMGSSFHAVFDEGDELMFVESSKNDPHSVFNELVERANKEMSKLISGNTMSIDDGSSRSQSEVHERIQNDYFRADIQFLHWVVNDQLIPFMRSHGFNIPEGSKFKYEFNEVLSLTEQFEIDKELLKVYEIPSDYISKKYGTPIEGEKNIQEQQNNSINNVLFDSIISKYYGKH